VSTRRRCGLPRAKRRKGEEGAGLLIILMMQSWSVTWRRDSEEELIARGNMYVDAILAYRKDHGGQFPTNLEDLAEQGQRRVRYIRRLYEDPIAPDGKWGLLYLMPGGQGIYDPGAAERQAAGGGSPFSAAGNPAGSALPPGPPGFTPLNMDPTGSGVARMPGMTPGAMPGGVPGGLPGGGLPGGGLPTPPRSGGWGGSDAEDEGAISEQPLGWPIVGVVSRASGWHAENTYKIYKGHSQVNEWQFHVFDRGLQLTEAPQAGVNRPTGSGFVGPGFGGTGQVRGQRRTIGGGGPLDGRGRRTGQGLPAGRRRDNPNDDASPPPNR
jgi:hypothetical protein